MTPKEKAEELLNKIENPLQGVTLFKELRKSLALIAVDEILNEYWSHDTNRRNWWEKVKQEIEKL